MMSRHELLSLTTRSVSRRSFQYSHHVLLSRTCTSTLLNNWAIAWLLVWRCCISLTVRAGNSANISRATSIICRLSLIWLSSVSIAWRMSWIRLIISSWSFASSSVLMFWMTCATIIKSSGFRCCAHTLKMYCAGDAICWMASCCSVGNATCCAIVWITRSKNGAACLLSDVLPNSRCTSVMTDCRMLLFDTVLLMRSRYSENSNAVGILLSSISAITVFCIRIRAA